ncbi:MAG: DUF1934 domain-containing protein [Oscillospiraceae bacterium]|jgi:uncharacterized beta-barrel protein YwiB (DUF1934 family)|nr:DUF1934 domain-containing protein [Oscillospiraceae bacterium]
MNGYTISIIGAQATPGEDEEKFELITDGLYTQGGDVSRISYTDSGVMGNENSETTFVVEPSRITLTRGAWHGGDMVFDEGEKHHFLYQTPFGSLMMGIDTESIDRNLSRDGGDLFIRYSIDVDNVIVSRNSFKISVKPS